MGLAAAIAVSVSLLAHAAGFVCPRPGTRRRR
jgi:hypothetical protein